MPQRPSEGASNDAEEEEDDDDDDDDDDKTKGMLLTIHAKQSKLTDEDKDLNITM